MDALNSNSDSDNPKNQTQNNDQTTNKVAAESAAASKPKRQMKSPFQLEQLEKAYALEMYPSEATRAELSEKLKLSDRQLQMWFCHRRLKDKKETSAKRQRKVVEESLVEEVRSGYGSAGSGRSSPFPSLGGRSVGVGEGVVSGTTAMGRRCYESPQSIFELRAIARVEAQLGEAIREDGPILGMAFDPLPPDAFGMPLAAPEQQNRSGQHYGGAVYERHDVRSNKVAARDFYEYQDRGRIRSDAYGRIGHAHLYDPTLDDPSGRSLSFIPGSEEFTRVHGIGQALSGQGLQVQPIPGHEDQLPKNNLNAKISSHYTGYPVIEPDNLRVSSDGQMIHTDSDLRIGKKRKNDEARMAREVEVHENRIRKELEKQDILRRKNEERMRKEMERQNRERQKEEERLMREKQREEERLQRELRREMERREKFLQREYIRAEKRKKKEELRLEKEELKRRAAVEKATARRLAKESMELIEDEQLELMELAAASKGLSSVVHLDYDSLQNLELFRGSLCDFPPKSIHLSRPVAIQPWMGSEENIGNLLMVWRFFVTFADVLKLWPFTLDEFVQAFHDYDSRLLGELHIALLRMIIKDIEDVARTPVAGLGTNQSSAANPEGGHPKIVEGAYAWGFDICNWQQHLNPLTWPEILRQLALSAGFGPQLKKTNTAWANLNDNDEIKCCEDIVSTLRSGSAAENAVAFMRDKGLLAPRRSRHRLTPGTVKFAAFHVLSLEGSRGLTVLELANEIQKSGLRDLTTSKTPEASISVALTRDTKLFERIAPSTYRVRAPYRKDPADAEAILNEARKKIQMFANGYVAAGEFGDDIERADDNEREEDFECDVDEDAEVYDLHTLPNADKNVENDDEENSASRMRYAIFYRDGAPNVHGESSKSSSLNGSKDAVTSNSPTERHGANKDFGAGNRDQEYVEIDERKSGELWVQGLTEGEYSHLSVEERLNALVALIGIANEGNSIRAVLEDRMEAANSLKKQMLAEAQLDKSRLKEDYINLLSTSKAEVKYIAPALDGSLLPVDDNKNTEASFSIAENQTHLSASQGDQNNFNSSPFEKVFVVQEPSTGQDNLFAQQHVYASKRSRSQLKSYIAHIAEDMYVYRSLPLGQDRRRNRYWQFNASISKIDPGAGRIFVELDHGKWRLVDSEEAFDALLKSLDTRGVRESHLYIMLKKIEALFRESVRRNFHLRSGSTGGNNSVCVNSRADCPADVDSPSSTICSSNSDSQEAISSIRIQLGRNEREKQGALKRYGEFQKWMSKECLNSLTLRAAKYGKKRAEQLLSICELCLDSYLFEDIHCTFCHQTFAAATSNITYQEHLIQCEENRNLGCADIHILDSLPPLGIRLLRMLLASMEVSIPPEALKPFWTDDYRTRWGRKLNTTSSTSELLQMLTLLENAVKHDRLVSGFQATREHSSTSRSNAAFCSANLELVHVLPWIPQTISAVVLRLLELDASIIYIVKEEGRHEDRETIERSKLPSVYPPSTNQETRPVGTSRNHSVKSDIFYSGSGRNSYSLVRGGHGQGYGSRSQKKIYGAKSDIGRRSKHGGNLNQRLIQQVGGLQVSGRGPRTIRSRPGKSVVKSTFQFQTADAADPKSNGTSLKNWDDIWSIKRLKIKQPMEVSNKSNSPEEGSDEDVEAQGSEEENWDLGFAGPSNRWSGGLMEDSDAEVDASEEDNDDNSIDDAADEDAGYMNIGEDSCTGNRYENEEDMDSGDSDDSVINR